MTKRKKKHSQNEFGKKKKGRKTTKKNPQIFLVL